MKNKVKEKVKVSTVDTNDEMKKLITITIIVILIFGFFYVITKLATERNFDDDKKPTEVEFNFEEIILGDLLNQKADEYFVLVTFEDDVFVSLYKSYLDKYYQKERPEARYYANINSIFNKKYIGEESNFDINNLKFKESTLIKVKNGKITETYEGRQNILEHLKNLVSE